MHGFISVAANCNDAYKVRNKKFGYTLTHGFTLIELLVVVAIIAVLVAILLPALNAARTYVKLITCQNNLRQIGLAIRMYADDYNNIAPLPTGGSVGYSLTAAYSGTPRGFKPIRDIYLKTDEVFKCPSARGKHSWPDNDWYYAYWYHGPKSQQIQRSDFYYYGGSNEVIRMETDETIHRCFASDLPHEPDKIIAPFHITGYNVLYGDLRVIFFEAPDDIPHHDIAFNIFTEGYPY